MSEGQTEILCIFARLVQGRTADGFETRRAWSRITICNLSLPVSGKGPVKLYNPGRNFIVEIRPQITIAVRRGWTT